MAAPPEWRAGVATVDITPTHPVWLGGFAERTHPADGVVAPLHAKALVLADATGARNVLVTADVLGFTASVSEEVARRVQSGMGIPRERISFNGSHTHWGPVIDHQLSAAYPMTPAQWADTEAYTRLFIDKVSEAVFTAAAHLQPVTLRYAETQAGFASNYRFKTEHGYDHRANPSGPVERVVPVLRLDDAQGRPFVVIFGYACHPTVGIGDEWLYKFHGDYAGFAQAALEREFPGATAMFVQGFAGDTKAEPRGSITLAEKHGVELAGNVATAVRGAKTAIHGPLTAAFAHVTLQFTSRGDRAEWQRRAAGDDVYAALNAKDMLAALDRDGHLPVDYEYPIQVWRFGQDLTWVAMGGETLVDYAIRFRSELGAGRLWLAGYSNDVTCYIPSVRVLKEGGYEPDDSMIYYSHPGPFDPSLEERIVAKTKELVNRLR